MTADLYADFARFYHEWSARLGEDEIRFYERRALEIDGPVVELAVGSGRVAIPVARAGQGIIGIDSSSAMLEIARRESKEASVDDRLTLVEADMRHWVAERPVGLVYIPGHSFQHMLTIEDQLACLRAARASLRSGGRLVLSVFIPDPARIVRDDGERRKESDFIDDLGRRCELWSQQDYEIVSQRMHLTAVFVAYEGEDVAERVEVPLDLHMFVPDEMRHLLARAGFVVEAVYGWFDERPLTEECREMIWVARKS